MVKRVSQQIKYPLTLPARLAHWFDVNVNRNALHRSLLATIVGRHHDFVVLLFVEAQSLCVSDVACRDEKNISTKREKIGEINLNTLSGKWKVKLKRAICNRCSCQAEIQQQQHMLLNNN